MQDNRTMEDASKMHVQQLETAKASFDENNAARAAMGKHVEELQLKLKSIETAVEKVQVISRQVTILSINASIEAARAGVAGKGFAVVAQEVGNLAKNTDNAVNDIESSMKQMNELLQKTAGDMETASKIGAEFTEQLTTALQDARGLYEIVSGETLPEMDAAVVPAFSAAELPELPEASL